MADCSSVSVLPAMSIWVLGLLALWHDRPVNEIAAHEQFLEELAREAQQTLPQSVPQTTPSPLIAGRYIIWYSGPALYRFKADSLYVFDKNQQVIELKSNGVFMKAHGPRGAITKPFYRVLLSERHRARAVPLGIDDVPALVVAHGTEHERVNYVKMVGGRYPSGQYLVRTIAIGVWVLDRRTKQVTAFRKFQPDKLPEKLDRLEKDVGIDESLLEIKTWLEELYRDAPEPRATEIPWYRHPDRSIVVLWLAIPLGFGWLIGSTIWLERQNDGPGN